MKIFPIGKTVKEQWNDRPNDLCATVWYAMQINCISAYCQYTQRQKYAHCTLHCTHKKAI